MPVEPVTVTPIPPPPTSTNPLVGQPGSKRQPPENYIFGTRWTQWFVQVKEKLDKINEALVALSGLTGSGIVVSNSSGSAATRTITGTAGEINVTNGDGVAGNPTINIIATGITPGSYHGLTFDADGRATAVNVVYTVATLPAGALGNTAFVSDSTLAIAAGLGLAPIGGGAAPVPVFHDGAGWKIG